MENSVTAMIMRGWNSPNAAMSTGYGYGRIDNRQSHLRREYSDSESHQEGV